MLYQIGIEDIESNHWVAWVFELPGCFSKALTRADAIANAPSSIAQYFEWLSIHNCKAPLAPESIEVEVSESFNSFISEGDYIVNAFFKDDCRLLSHDEIEHALRLLEYTRSDLLQVIQRMSSDQLDKSIRGEVQGSIRGILKHVAWAEWWYFDRLNLAFKEEQMPDDVMRMLEKVRTHTRHQLLQLAGNTTITERIGEQWSARKIVRRTLWHECAHTQQIIRYLKQ
jgi:predicted RNase H-like HicB family nuclease/succinate dehydrogenase flavin-adding protein (antitoxin of CptAB toxin-antitoxin module)